MAPSKQWMELVDNRLDEVYLAGVQKFLDYAFQRTGEEHEIRCPCVKCFNTILGTRKTVETHLLVYDGDGDAVEECESEDEVEELLRDLYPNLDGGSTHTDCDDLLEEEPNVEAKCFYNLLKDFEKPLYKNSKASKLSSLIKLLHIKSIGRWSNASFTMLLKLLKDELLPDDADLPNSYYEEDNLLDSCKICGASRWRINTHSGEIKNKKVDPCNVRLGLASDGFQPFRNSTTSHSIWPVVLIPYNLPPWLCMKQENFILSMLIPGPNGPGDAIDTYLQPLIEELKELWDVGIETYDASTRKNFKLHASLLWTINDFPAYGNLSGWSTKGKLACPCCNKDTASIRLTNCKKQCFMEWRNETKSFDGTQEKRPPPKMRSGIEILNQVQDLEGLQLSKDPKKRKKISHENRNDKWNKKSIFFQLPYWKCLLLRHNLDVMHIE
ncbi:uncharacterized protein LOC125877411 [Solanum stenotomum]|uniref:uncharacterized protein LOC125877411 n=1 Tax=Solanum stenotomum TaxID=172797 RepID=UPI0020D0B4C1|nr:uncharacterized protein LOC125877411 [Solanum stenotomum]